MGINQSKDVLNHSKIFIACEWSIAIVVLQALTFTNFQTCINKIYYNEKNNKQGMTSLLHLLVKIYVYDKEKSELRNRK